jgi:hypothetical protein
MKKLFLLGIISCLIAGTLPDVNLTAPTDGYYYDNNEGSVSLNVPADMWVYAEITQPLTSVERYRLPENSFLWKIYWDNANVFNPAAVPDWRPFRLGQERLFRVSQNTTVHLGLGVRRVPSVQPEGIYRTNILYTIAP